MLMLGLLPRLPPVQPCTLSKLLMPLSQVFLSLKPHSIIGYYEQFKALLHLGCRAESGWLVYARNASLQVVS